MILFENSFASHKEDYYFHMLHKASSSNKEWYVNCCQHTFSIYVLLDGKQLVRFNKGTFYMEKGDVFLINNQTCFEALVHKGPHEYLLINFNIENVISVFTKQVKRAHEMFFEPVPFLHLNPSNMIGLLENLEEIKKSFSDASEIKDLKSLSKLLECIFKLRDIYKYRNSYINQISADYSSTVAHILKSKSYINENFQEYIDLDVLAEYVGVSKEHLSREFKKEVGMTIIEYIHRIRVEQAAYLLEHTMESITEICFMSGFSTISQFNRTFKKHFKIPPSKYRKKLEKETKAIQNSIVLKPQLV